MPERARVTKELAQLLGVLAHPHRIRIVEELKDTEKDVNTLQEALAISHSGVSQHLAILRAHRLVLERKEGRHVYYSLRQPGMARWLLDALPFLEPERHDSEELVHAIERVKALWGEEGAKEN